MWNFDLERNQSVPIWKKLLWLATVIGYIYGFYVGIAVFFLHSRCVFPMGCN